MPVKVFLSIVLLVCLGVHTAFSQDASIEITGQVKDAQSGFPLEAVNIAVNKSGTGTVSNGSGNFRLRAAATMLKDTLRISRMGYQVKYLPVAITQQGGPLQITLEPVGLSLKEVVVEAKDPIKLIQSAIKKIPDNYITTPHLVRGFFRTITKRDQDYMQLSEAVFDIFNRGYASNAGNQLYLLRVRYIRDEEASHGLDLGLKPKNLFEYDVVKEIQDSKIFGQQGLKDHLFTIQGIVDYKGSPAYEITFDQRDGLKKSLFRGKFYLDKATLAFLRIDYVTSPKGKAYADFGDLPTKTLMSILDIHIKPVKDALSVEYDKVGDRWVLSGVTGNTALNFRSNKKKYNFTTNTKVDYIITRVDTTKTSASSEGKKLGNNKLIEFQTTPLDAAFWRQNTIILPNFDAEAVATQLKSRNESNSLKKRAQSMLQRLPANPSLRIDSLLSYYYQKQQFNGTVLVKTKEGVIFNKSYGYADQDQKITADSSTAYRIGSLSKSFTAMVIMQLAQDGKLQLTDSIKKFMPDYIHGDVTIEQLLTHQSGIPNYTNNSEYLSRIVHQPFSLDELVTKFCSDSLEFTPGTQFQYSNSGYVVLACIAEHISRQPFATILKQRIFIPAGMVHTYAGADTPAVSRKAIGYLYGKPEPPYNTINTLGAGGITSTAADLLKWDAALAGDKLLPKDKVAELFKPRAEYTDWDATYGYGWMTDKRLFAVTAVPHVITYHPGTDFGFYTMFVRQVDKDNVIIMLNNTGDFPRFDLTDLILTAIN